MLLDRPATRVDEAMQIALDPGAIRFVEPVDTDGTGVVGLDIVVHDPSAALGAARNRGLPTTQDSIRICGVAIQPVRGS